MHGANRSLIFLLFCSLAVFAIVPRLQFLDRQPHIIARQIVSTSSPPLPPPTTTSTTSTTSTRTDTTSVSSSSDSLTTSSSSTTSTTESTTTSATSSSESPTTTDQPTTPTLVPTPSTSADVRTNSNGDVVTSIVTITPSHSAPTSSQSSSDQNATPVSSGLGTGSIIGLSVAGGIALIVIVGFFIWKFTRKRFSDFDDNEAIKWPELNTHGGDSHPLPVNNTGRAGFDTGSEIDLQNDSDPYAVPPLPHLNPNQPYRDDPSATGYYDPYRGPIPNTFSDTASVDAPTATGWSAAEAIPMTQMSRARSPGPQTAYEGGPGVPGRRSPGPQAAYGLGEDRARSPGPGVGLGGMPPGRRSPGPQAAYDPGYGPR